MESGRAVVLKALGEPLTIDEYPVPELEPGAILLRITQAGICGSDLHTTRGHTSQGAPPGQGRAMGHEGNGVIHRLGPGVSTDSLGQPLHEGDRVVHSAVMPCYRCRYCLRGEYNWCPSYPSPREAGIPPYFVGTFADYYYLPPNHPVFKVPDDVPDSSLSFLNCALGTVTEGLLQAGVTPDKAVVLFGAGGLGLCATAIARHLGAQQVIILDRQQPRLGLATRMGADATVNIDEYATPEARLERIRELTGGFGADIVMELVGNSSLMEEGVGMLANGGTFVQIGANPPTATATIHPAHMLRGKRIIGSLMYRPRVMPILLDLLGRRRDLFPFDQVVSRRYPLEQVNEAFAELDWQKHAVDVTRAVLVP